MLILFVSSILNGAELETPTASHLPRWRGFNLLEKFMKQSGPQPFREKDFQLISKLGFNFVRLPMDYRIWAMDEKGEQFKEKELLEIDQAVEWGKQYGIHVCLNFHRAPGFTVAKPAEPKNLWTDPEIQEVCAKHWGMFAQRYRGIPNDRLSFNLFNEPNGISAAQYLPVVKKIVAAIRAEDPERLIISDGLDWGTKPIPELKELGLAQATRGYRPMNVTHYQASWVNTQGQAFPQWPQPMRVPGTLLAPEKKEGSYPLVIEGTFSKPMTLRFKVGAVSHFAQLILMANGKKVFEREFRLGPGKGEWQRSDWVEKYKIYQGYYGTTDTVVIPEGTTRLEFRVARGDWLELSEISLEREGEKPEIAAFMPAYGEKPPLLVFNAERPPGNRFQLPAEDRDWLWKTGFLPWKNLEGQGVGVMVGEWGCYNKTPHDVVLRWAEDHLQLWKEAGWGWALWNFRGSFGILDSERADVTYEKWEGHQLDRKLLELLQRY